MSLDVYPTFQEEDIKATLESTAKMARMNNLQLLMKGIGNPVHEPFGCQSSCNKKDWQQEQAERRVKHLQKMQETDSQLHGLSRKKHTERPLACQRLQTCKMNTTLNETLKRMKDSQHQVKS
jgi:hypothetical protein